MSQLHKALATVGGVGNLPLAPGTWGAAVGTLCLLPLCNVNPWFVFCIVLIIAVSMTYIGANIAKKLEPEWGEDPKQFVLDEFVGVWIAVLGHSLTLQTLLLSFVLFRIFDIWKPLGIRRWESVPNGWGVMLDDVAAGVWANIFLWILYWFY